MAFKVGDIVENIPGKGNYSYTSGEWKGKVNSFDSCSISVETLVPKKKYGDKVGYKYNGLNASHFRKVEVEEKQKSTYKLGDKVKIIGNCNCHGESIGSIATLKKLSGGSYTKDSNGYCWDFVEHGDTKFRECDFVLVKPKEEAIVPKFKDGDKVKVIGNSNSNHQPMGKILTILRSRVSDYLDDECYIYWCKENSYCFRECDLELVSNNDIVIFREGQLLKVVDSGRLYTTYQSMADKLGAVNYKIGEHIKNGDIVSFVKYGEDEDREHKRVICLVNKGTDQYLIGYNGLAIFEQVDKVVKIKPSQPDKDALIQAAIIGCCMDKAKEIAKPVVKQKVVKPKAIKPKVEKEEPMNPSKEQLDAIVRRMAATTKTEEVIKVATPGIVDRIKTAGNKVVSKQCGMAKAAATLEAARILNIQLVKILSEKKVLPMMLRGYADTPLGKAVIANALFMGMEIALPNVSDDDVRKQVARAAVVQSYGEFMASFKAEDMLNDLFNNPALKKLTDQISASEED